MLRTTAIALGVALMMAPASASASDYRGELGVVFGAVKQSEELSNVEDQPLHDSSPVLGGRLGFLLSDRWGWFAEGTHSWIKTARPEGETGTWDVRSGLELYGPELWDGAPLYLTGHGGLEHISFEEGDSIDRPIVGGGLGQRIPLGSNAIFRWEGRVTHAFEDEEDLIGEAMTHWGAIGVISYVWGGRDTDQDGVKDAKDDCPQTPLGAHVDPRGCPTDADGDGVYDGLDTCADTPAGARVDASGCPTDSDGDGVFDGLDACPDTPAGARIDATGCALDSDSDGIADGIDQCDGTPAGAVVDARGCPTDSDGDGVFDGLDQCPNTEAGTRVDERGCAVLFEEEKAELVLEGVQFEFNRADLKDTSTATLDRVAASLMAWPEIRVEVGGHTDSRGRDAYNLDLSTRRAAAVRDYLIQRGVPADQLTSHGYGETRPVADNDTEDGRARNRRVELRRID